MNETRNPGMRIVEDFERPPNSVVELFRDVPSANIADVTSRLFAMSSDILPRGKARKILGPALTVKASMADNFMFHKAISLAESGDVIVVDSCGDINYSVCGDVMYRYAIKKGVAGFVVNGCIRDLDYLFESEFPVYAKGVTPRGPYKNPVGEINTDIACGGQVVHPGDIIVGDGDGITVIRKEDAEVISLKLKDIMSKESSMTELIENDCWEADSPILTMINNEIDRLEFEVIKRVDLK